MTELTLTSEVPSEYGVRVSADTVEITGYILLGSPCYEFAASTELGTQTLGVTLVVTKQNVPCVQVVTGFGYRIRVRQVPPGEYAFALRHCYAGVARDTTVLTQSVTVH